MECHGNKHCQNNQFCEFNGCLVETGVCVEIPMLCPDVYAPVCGCDGQTYSNNCERKWNKVSLQYKGECGVNPDCDIRSTMEQGETKTYVLGNVEYEVELIDVSNNAPYAAIFVVNGETTHALQENEKYTLVDGTVILVREIVSHTETAYNIDIVEFCLNDGNMNDCEDTDSGKDYYTKGTAVMAQRHEDYCKNPYDLIEYSCEGDEIKRNERFYLKDSGNGVDLAYEYKGISSSEDKVINFKEIETGLHIEIIVNYDNTAILNVGGTEYKFLVLEISDSISGDALIRLVDDVLILEEEITCENSCLDGACFSDACVQLNQTFMAAYDTECGSEGFDERMDFGSEGNGPPDCVINLWDLMIFVDNMFDETWCREIMIESHQQG
jgi:hypothetical protein